MVERMENLIIGHLPELLAALLELSHASLEPPPQKEQKSHNNPIPKKKKWTKKKKKVGNSMPLYRELLLIKITDKKNIEGKQAIECYHQTAYEEKKNEFQKIWNQIVFDCQIWQAQKK